MMFLAACAFVLLIVSPAPASAWGPITHLAHGSGMLENLTILSIALQRLLRRHRLEYLYGCIGADITQAKKYTRAQQAHCHSWPVGWLLLERAGNDAQRAFAYGYLTHLAGDVYSHNHYVPTQLIVSFRARTLRHVYWEARFDAQQHDVGRDIIRELRGHRFPECDALVRDVVSRTLFSFGTDKRIFRGFIAIHDLQQWHQVMKRLSVRSRYVLLPDVVRRYNHACHASIVDLLQHEKQSACQSADPIGMQAITLAKQVRRSLKMLDRRRNITPKLQATLDALDERLDLESADLSVPLCAVL